MYRDDLLARETILITGGGTGLGRAMGERFAALGARVAIVGRREEPLREAVAALGGAERAAYAVADVRDEAQLTAAIDDLESRLAPVTALVNNAAGNFLSAAEDLSAGGFDAVVKIVLYGSVNATMALGRRWIARRSGGKVLSIVTTYAWTGSAFVLPSACAKAGVLAMTRSLAVEWADYGIRCNAIAPGLFPTEGAFSRLMPDEMREQTRRSIPAGRFGEPTELADLAAFIMSPMAAYMNGECVVLDGGDWLKNGQSFGRLTDWPRDQLKGAMAAMRPRK